VESFFSRLFAGDPSGRSWLPELLAAAPRGREALGELVDEPGSLEIALAVKGASGRLACFDYPAAPPRELLAWFIDHPDRLEWPDGVQLPPTVERLRRALIEDDPPGARAKAQDRAREHLPTASPFTDEWWRFEDVTTPDCALLTNRLVLTVIGKRTEPLVAASAWYPPRSELVRALEAAKQLSQGRRWASLVLSDEPLPDASAEHLTRTLAAGAPHLNDSQREELRAAYLGNLTWSDARAATQTVSRPK
jgi:hypothetical protein